MILAPLQKLPKNVKDLGKLIVPKGIKKLLKVQKIANYGHTEQVASSANVARRFSLLFTYTLIRQYPAPPLWSSNEANGPLVAKS